MNLNWFQRINAYLARSFLIPYDSLFRLDLVFRLKSRNVSLFQMQKNRQKSARNIHFCADVQTSKTWQLTILFRETMVHIFIPTICMTKRMNFIRYICWWMRLWSWIDSCEVGWEIPRIFPLIITAAEAAGRAASNACALSESAANSWRNVARSSICSRFTSGSSDDGSATAVGAIRGGAMCEFSNMPVK